MSSKSDGKMDEPAEYWAANEDLSEGSIKHLPSLSDTGRSLTPKGPLFHNLGEAHQAITSRLASQSTRGHIPEASAHPSSPSCANVSSTAGSAGSLLSAEDIEFIKPDGPVRRRCLTPFFGAASTSAEWIETSVHPSSIHSPVAPSAGSSDSVGGDMNNSAAEDSTISEPLDAHGNPLDEIFEIYYMPSPTDGQPTSAHARQSQRASRVAPLTNDDLSHLESSFQSVSARSPDIQRAKTGTDLGKHHWKMYHPVNDPAPRSLPELPHAQGGIKHIARESDNDPLNFSRHVPSLRSGSNSYDLMAMSTSGSQGSALAITPSVSTASHRSAVAQPTNKHAEPNLVGYGRSLARPAQEILKNRLWQEGDASHGGISNTGVSTDSDEDPFKYDRTSFGVFLRPSREREVSAALRRVSGGSTASASGVFQPSPSHEPATPRVTQSKNPFVNRLQCYQAPILEYNWDDEDCPSEVKISVRSPCAPRAPPPTPVQSPVGLSELALQRLGSQRRRRDVNTLMSDGADWETVATSIGQFDSNRAFASSMGLSGSHPVKVTGSSIADYSDTSSVHGPQVDVFSSRERIVQHPSANDTSGPRYRRNLKDTHRPVFLPKPRIHTVNGYLHNANRVFTNHTTGSSANSTKSALVEKLSASIRSRNAKKRAQRRSLSLNAEQWSKTRFESLDSLSSAYSEQPGEPSDERMAGSSQQKRPAGNSHLNQRGLETNNGLLASPFPKQPSAAHLRDKTSTLPHPSHDSWGFASPTLFNFPLISLEEATQRMTVRMENDDDLTVSGGVRTRKNSSMDTSNATQKTTPVASYIKKPVPTHSRRPTSASILGIPIADRGGPGYSQGMSNDNPRSDHYIFPFPLFFWSVVLTKP